MRVKPISSIAAFFSCSLFFAPAVLGQTHTVGSSTLAWQSASSTGAVIPFTDNGSIMFRAHDHPLSGDVWTTKAPMPTARDGLAVGAPGNGNIYAIGGDTLSPTTLFRVRNSCEEYDPSTNTWTEQAPMPPARAGLAGGARVNGKI